MMGFNLGLRAKLLGSSFVVLTLVLAFTVSGLFIFQETARETKDIYLIYNQGLQELQTVSLNFYKANRRSSDLALSYVTSRRTLNIKAVGYELEEALKQVTQGFEEFQTVVDAGHRSEATQELIDQFRTDLTDWTARLQKQLEVMNDKASFEDVFYDGQLNTVFDNLTGALDSMAVEMQIASEGAYDAYKTWNDLATILFLSFAATILILVLLVVYFQTRVIVRPILRVHQFLAGMATGDADLTKTLPVVSRDEVGQICSNFNTFLIQLRTIVTKVQDSMAETETVAGSLHTDSLEVASSLGEINANNQGISTNMGVLDARLAEADGSTTELLRALDGLRQRVGDEGRLVESSTASIRTMIEGIHGVTEISRTKRQASAELVAVSRESGRQLEEASAAVGRINSAVDTILDMTQVVSAIASQTNLLSMNAAIEAAHAGSAGAGFSVVADEIRKLATTSTSQSADIGKELKSIVGEIQTAWDLTHQAQSSYGKLMEEVGGVDKALVEIMERNENLQTLGGNILGSLEGLSLASHAVGKDMETIDRSTATVATTMGEVRRVSSEVSTGMQEIAQGTQDITMATQNGSDSNRRLVDQVQAVRTELGRFKVAE